MSSTFSRTLKCCLIQLYLSKNKSIKPPPLMFSWAIYKFFKIAEAVTGGIP